MHPNPLISIIIPTYNRPALLRRALNSLSKQTYKTLEIIVVDDASKESYEEVVKFFNWPNFTYLKDEDNHGISKTRNRGLKQAAGEYIALMDDDDEFLPEKLEIQLKTALSLPDKSFILCNGEYVGGNKKYVYDIDKPTGFIDPEKKFFPMNLQLPMPSSWFFHRQLMEQVGYFDEELARWEDSDYLVRLAKKYPVYMLNKPLVMWHVTPVSITAGGFNKIDIVSRQRFLFKHFESMKKDKDYAYRFCWRLGKDLEEIGMGPQAKDCFMKAWSVKPYKLEVLGKLIRV